MKTLFIKYNCHLHLVKTLIKNCLSHLVKALLMQLYRIKTKCSKDHIVHTRIWILLARRKKNVVSQHEEAITLTNRKVEPWLSPRPHHLLIHTKEL